jgi:hypothetical protein
VLNGALNGHGAKRNDVMRGAAGNQRAEQGCTKARCAKHVTLAVKCVRMMPGSRHGLAKAWLLRAERKARGVTERDYITQKERTKELGTDEQQSGTSPVLNIQDQR